MAIILVFVGSLSGILAGITSLIAFDASIWQALAVWVGTGIFITFLGLAIAITPKRPANPRLETA